MFPARNLLALAAALFLAPSARAGQALLWVPAAEGGAEEVIAALEETAGARLTAAFHVLPKGLEERVKKLEAEGRLELALRPAGDPPLPLLYYPAAEEVKWEGKPSTTTLRSDQYFLSLRLSLAREAAVKALGKAPQGLVSPPGGLAPDYFPLARALGVKWLACGPLASTASAVMEAAGVYAVPFVNFSTAAPQGAPGFTLFDETSAPDPAWLRAMLAAELRASVPEERLTVSGALPGAVSTAAAPAEISAAAAGWQGDYSRWASSPLQAGALAALAQTREALMLHLNAAQGNYAKAAPAFNEYFSAEDGARLLALASGDAEVSGEAETALRTALSDAYRLMHKSPPPWALAGLGDARAALAQTDKMSVENLPDGFLITNSARPAVPPEHTPGLPASADPALVWKLEALRVTTGEAGSLFQFKPAALDNSLKEPSGFSHLRLDLYMDVNRRHRAGITRTLQGRPFRIYPENAWEYALEVTPAGAVLYKITPQGQVRAGSFPATAQDGWIQVLLPPSALRGSPGLWSYAALLLAPKAAGYAVTDQIAENVANGYVYFVYPGRK
jgi:hypothetical protein